MKHTVLLALCISLVCCQESENNDVNSTIESAVAASDMSEADRLNELEAIKKEEQKQLASTTSMSFDKMIIDFGKIKEDSENKASFIVKNTGSFPLIIEKVDVSCGCTTAKKPEQPIMPSKSDKIEIVFHPKIGQLDTQEKTVTITANTDPSTEVLKIKAFVIKK